MNITNTMCRLSDLTQEQIDSLVDAIPKSGLCDFSTGSPLIGATRCGNWGTWAGFEGPKIVTYTEMMQLLGKTMEFTKSDLKTGMFVKYRDGGIRLVLGDTLTGDFWRGLDEVKFNLMSKDAQRHLDIMSVYKSFSPATISTYLNGGCLKLIWERTEQTPAQKEMQEILLSIEKAEKDMVEMKEQAKVLQAKL
jgi:hypothetical protein